MHSWGFALREGVFAKPKEIYIKIQNEREEGAVKQAGPAASRSCELLSTGTMTRQGWSSRRRMRRWGFALREGVFAETKEGKCRNKREKS